MLKLIQLVIIFWKLRIKRMFPIFLNAQEKQAISNVNEINKILKNGNRQSRRATKVWLRKNLK
jgi:hypothetical protein